MASVMMQPQAISTHTTVTMMGTLDWSTGVCDCCEDCAVCCCALWCFPCLMCDTASEFGECLCLPLLDPCSAGCSGCTGVCSPVSLAMRASIRERYRIPGSICNDCLVLSCCYSCAWCQMAREIKQRRQTINVANAYTTITTTSATVPLLQSM